MPVLKASRLSQPHSTPPHTQTLFSEAQSWVGIHALKLNAIIGIHPHERLNPQPLHIDLSFHIPNEDWASVATTGELKYSLDYSEVCRVVSEVVKFGEFRLLESLAWLIAQLYLRPPLACEQRASIDRMRFKLSKPNVLRDLYDAIPEISGEMVRDQFQTTYLKRGDELSLTERFSSEAGGDDALTVTPLLRLPEVIAIHLRAEAPGLLTLRSDEHLIALGGELLIEDEVASWMGPMSAVHLTRCPVVDGGSSNFEPFTSPVGP